MAKWSKERKAAARAKASFRVPLKYTEALDVLRALEQASRAPMPAGELVSSWAAQCGMWRLLADRVRQWLADDITKRGLI